MRPRARDGSELQRDESELLPPPDGAESDADAQAATEAEAAAAEQRLPLFVATHLETLVCAQRNGRRRSLQAHPHQSSQSKI